MIEALPDLEVPKILITLIMMTMERSATQVKSMLIKYASSARRWAIGYSFIILLHFVTNLVGQSGTIFNKSTQSRAYADDIGVQQELRQGLWESSRNLRKEQEVEHSKCEKNRIHVCDSWHNITNSTSFINTSYLFRQGSQVL